MSWSRLVGQLFGHTVQSAGLVLGAYMAGLAVGYALASRVEVARPLRAYGWAEIAAAVGAAGVPVLLGLAEGSGLGGLMHAAPPALTSALRFAVCFVILLPATTAMGATLPFMAEWLERDGAGSGRGVAWFYGLNTVGALAGVGVALAFLMVWVGVRGSTYLAVGISAACGATALVLARRERGRDRETAPPAPCPWVPSWTVAVALAGFSVMGLEVLYARVFALVFHNSTYTFGLVVAVALGSLAIGAWIVGSIRDHVERLARGAAVAAAVFVPLSLCLFLEIGDLEYFRFGGSFSTYMLGALGLVAIVVVPPLAALGVLLPASWRVVGGTGRVGGGIVGRMTTVSTLAGVAGALLTSFLCLPLLGLWSAFALVVALVLLVAIVLIGAARGRRLGLGLLAAAMAVAAACAVGSLARHPGDALARDPLNVERWEGAYGWTDLTHDPETGHSAIVQNLHYSMGSTKPMARELWQGDLPLLMHPDPTEVAFLGMGTGITASSALDHPSVERVVVMELISEVVEAARRLADDNASVLDDPRVVLVVDDARHVLQLQDRSYDVVVSDLFVPWESRTGYLYTLEHYQLVRERLNPGGLFCQWLALYQVGQPELESILDSFATAFPVTTLWWGDTNSRWPLIGIVGSEEPLALDVDAIAARHQLLHQRELPRRTSHQPVVEQYLASWRLAQPHRLNTDEHPWVEFRAPMAHRDTRLIQDDRLQALYDSVLSELPRAGVVVMEGGAPAALPPPRAPRWVESD